MQNSCVVIYFVDFREKRSFLLPQNTGSPYGALCRFLSSDGTVAFRLICTDEYNNFLPILSDRSLVDALRSRRNPEQPLRIFAKAIRAYTEFSGHGNYACGQMAANRLKSGSLKERSEAGDYRKPSEWTQRLYVNKKEHFGRETVKAVVMPKDPTLSELVDSVRQSLEVAISRFCVETEKPSTQKCKVDESVSSVQEKVEIVEVILKDEKESEESDDAAAPDLLIIRPGSSASEDYMVLTPTTDSCTVGFDTVQELEAAIFDLENTDNEDAFEIVDAPDEWDSDTEWNADWTSSLVAM